MSNLTINQQKAAVDFLLTNCVVTAGAGSGKTRVLTHRYVNLLAHHQQSPALLSQMVAITFTDKAATEMKERIRQEIEKRIEQAEEQRKSEEKQRWQELWSELEQARISTFHSFCQRLIQAEPMEAGVDPHFSILNEQEAFVLLNESIREIYTSFWPEHIVGAELEEWFIGNNLTKIEKSIRQVIGKLHSLGWDVKQLKQVTEESLLRQWKKQGEELLQIKKEKEQLPTVKLLEQELFATAEQILKIKKPGKSLHSFLENWDHWRFEWQQNEQVEERLELLKRMKKNDLKGNWGKNRSFKEQVLEIVEQMIELMKLDQQLSEKQKALDLIKVEKQMTHSLVEMIALIRKRYGEKKQERQVLDFDDLQEKAVQLLEKHPGIRRRYQKQIRYLLVDEYQDTNHIQKRLIDLLCKDEQGRIPAGKLFVVGDPKQSIYRFRGADVSLFTKIQQEIQANQGEVVMLDTNFRSDPTLIDFYNHIFPQLMQEGQEHPNSYQPVLSRERVDSPQITVDWIAVPQKEAWPEGWTKEKVEATMIARHISQLCNNGYSPKDMTILMRSMPQVKIYEQALTEAKIPYRVIGGRGFYERQEVLDLLHLLRILVDPRHRLAWAGVLRSPFCGVADETILRIALDDQWQGGIGKWINLPNLPRREREKLVQFASTLEEIQRNLGHLPIPQLLEQILQESGYLEVLLTLPNHQQTVANVKKLIQLSRDLTGLSGLSVQVYLDWIEQIQESEKEETEAPIELEDSDSLKIMTIHQSKGLEFPVVYLPRLGSSPRPSDSLILVDDREGLVVQMRNKAGEEIQTDRWEQVKDKEKRLEWEESVRLFYVATTRAEQRLVLCGQAERPRENTALEEIKEWNKWLDRVLSYDLVDTEQKIWPYAEKCMPISIFTEFVTKERSTDQPNDSLLDQYIAGELSPRLPVVEPPFLQPCSLRESDLIELSVTNWKQLVNCPRKYYYKQVVGMPEISEEVESIQRERTARKRKLPATIKGQMVHLLCEWMMEPTEDMELDTLWPNLWSAFQVLPADQEAVKRELTPYLIKFIQSDLYREKAKWKSIFREWSFTEQMSGLMISGQIDLLCEDQQGKWYLFDYKTDYIQTDQLDQLTEKSFEYEPQLQLYVLALQQKYGWVPQQATLYFLEPNLCYTFDITEEWLLLAKQRLKKTGEYFCSTKMEDWPLHKSSSCQLCSYRMICLEEEDKI